MRRLIAALVNTTPPWEKRRVGFRVGQEVPAQQAAQQEQVPTVLEQPVDLELPLETPIMPYQPGPPVPRYYVEPEAPAPAPTPAPAPSEVPKAPSPPAPAPPPEAAPPWWYPTPPVPPPEVAPPAPAPPETPPPPVPGEVPAALPPGVPGDAAPLLDPEAIIKILQAAGRAGDTRFTSYSQPINCPWGASTELVLNIPAGFVCVSSKSFLITSDYYDSRIEVEAYIDDVLVTPEKLILTDPLEVDLGRYGVKRNTVKFVVNNGSSTDAMVTVRVNVALLADYLFTDFYVPLTRTAVMALSDISEKMGGIRL